MKANHSVQGELAALAVDIPAWDPDGLPDADRDSIIGARILVEICWKVRTSDGMLITARYGGFSCADGLSQTVDVMAASPPTV